MLKNLNRVSGNIYRWKIWLRLPSRLVHTHVELTEEAAHAMYSELLEEKACGALGLEHTVRPVSISLDDAAKKYEQYIMTLGHDNKHVTDTVRSVALLREMFPRAVCHQVTRENVMAWQERRSKVLVNESTPKPRTVNKALAELRRFFSWCQEMGWIRDNPAAIPKLKEEEPPLRMIEWNVYEKFADAAWKKRPALALLIEVVAETGCRISEAIDAKAGDIDKVRGVWSRIVKGGKRKTIRVGKWAIEAAKRAPTPDAPLCPREDGKPFRYHAVERAFLRLSAKAKLGEITPHFLRHGRATWDVDAGLPARAVQKQLGHTSMQTTERYFRAAEAGDLPQHKATKRRDPKNVLPNVAKQRQKRSSWGSSG